MRRGQITVAAQPRRRAALHSAETRVLDLGIPYRPLVRVDEAAVLLACSETQVRRLSHSGRLEAVTIGHAGGGRREHTRITTESIKRLVGMAS